MKSSPHTLRSVIVGTVLSVICAGAIHAAVVYYRQAKAMEHAIDTLGDECRENGGCTLPAPLRITVSTARASRTMRAIDMTASSMFGGATEPTGRCLRGGEYGSQR